MSNKIVDLLFELNEGDMFKITEVEHNSLSEYKKYELLGIFQLKNKNTKRKLPNIFKPSLTEVIIENFQGDQFSLLIKSDEVIFFDKEPNGVNIHGQVKNIEKTKYF